MSDESVTYHLLEVAPGSEDLQKSAKPPTSPIAVEDRWAIRTVNEMTRAIVET